MKKYTMKYFNENAKSIPAFYSYVYILDGHRIVITECGRCSRNQYYSVCVDEHTIATRAVFDNTIRITLNYLNTL